MTGVQLYTLKKSLPLKCVTSCKKWKQIENILQTLIFMMGSLHSYNVIAWDQIVLGHALRYMYLDTACQALLV